MMTENDPIIDVDATDAKPRNSRQPQAGRKITFSRIQDGKAIPFGSFPEAVIGEPLERRLLPFIEERNFGGGEWKVDVRNAKGHFERSYDFTIADTEPDDRERVIDIEPENEGDETEFDNGYDISGEIAVRAELIAMRREMKELRQREHERQETVKDSESNALTLIREMQKQSEKSFQQGLQMAQMIMQSAQPKENPSELMLSMLKGTLEVQRGVRQLSEEIAPSGSGEGDGGYLAGGAKLLDSLGRNAGTFLPILAGLMPKAAPTAAALDRNDVPFPANGNAGEFANLADKIQKKEAAKK